MELIGVAGPTWLTGWAGWVLGAGVVAIVAIVTLFTFRSLNRWQQPPPGKGPDAEGAESFLSWMTRTRGDKG